MPKSRRPAQTTMRAPDLRAEDEPGPEPEAGDELDSFLREAAARVEDLLDRLLPPVGEDPAAGPSLSAAMRHAALGGGKRIRPAAAMAASVAVGGKAEDALLAAGAVELIHTYSLIHDDLPCMDDDELRRGRPTVHVAYGEAMAVLAGDALHALAFETLAGPSPANRLSPARRAEAVHRLAAAAGHAGMAGGQALDIEAETRAPDASGLEAIHRRKTGALLGAAAALGALAGGGSAEQVEALDRAGRELGLVFQIVDDLLDEEATTEALGKSAGKDRAAGKATYPALHGLAAARDEARRRTGSVRRRIAAVPDASPRGIGLLQGLAARILHRGA